MSLTCRYISTLAPSMVNETAIVMIMAMVIVTLRHSPTRTSVRTYFSRIGGFLPELTRQMVGQSDGR